MIIQIKPAVRYQFNGLYCPRAKDFLPPQEELVRVPEFLEACCKRLERLFPDVPHVASLVKEMREFAKNEVVAEFPELDDSHQGGCDGGAMWFDESLPE